MIKIVTDTASDITPSQALALGVQMVTLNVTFGDVQYDQSQDDTFDLFYQMLAANKQLPVTSQPSPDAFLRIFEDAKQNGDEIVAILLSGSLSGTVQSATIAKEMCGYENIHIIDSRQAIIGQRLLVEYAVQLTKDGKTGEDISAAILEASPRIRLYGALDTLKYLRKGGRIPATTEMLGTMMGIKPLVRLEGGVLSTAGKARGHAGAVTNMIRLVDEAPHFDPATPVYFGYTGTQKQLVAFRQLCIQRYKLTNTVTCPVGSVVGTHIGPGAFAIAYLAEN